MAIFTCGLIRHTLDASMETQRFWMVQPLVQPFRTGKFRLTGPANQRIPVWNCRV